MTRKKLLTILAIIVVPLVFVFSYLSVNTDLFKGSLLDTVSNPNSYCGASDIKYEVNLGSWIPYDLVSYGSPQPTFTADAKMCIYFKEGEHNMGSVGAARESGAVNIINVAKLSAILDELRPNAAKREIYIVGGKKTSGFGKTKLIANSDLGSAPDSMIYYTTLCALRSRNAFDYSDLSQNCNNATHYWANKLDKLVIQNFDFNGSNFDLSAIDIQNPGVGITLPNGSVPNVELNVFDSTFQNFKKNLAKFYGLSRLYLIGNTFSDLGTAVSGCSGAGVDGRRCMSLVTADNIGSAFVARNLFYTQNAQRDYLLAIFDLTRTTTSVVRSNVFVNKYDNVDNNRAMLFVDYHKDEAKKFKLSSNSFFSLGNFKPTSVRFINNDVKSRELYLDMDYNVFDNSGEEVLSFADHDKVKVRSLNNILRLDNSKYIAVADGDRLGIGVVEFLGGEEVVATIFNSSTAISSPLSYDSYKLDYTKINQLLSVGGTVMMSKIGLSDHFASAEPLKDITGRVFPPLIFPGAVQPAVAPAPAGSQDATLPIEDSQAIVTVDVSPSLVDASTVTAGVVDNLFDVDRSAVSQPILKNGPMKISLRTTNAPMSVGTVRIWQLNSSGRSKLVYYVPVLGNDNDTSIIDKNHSFVTFASGRLDLFWDGKFCTSYDGTAEKVSYDNRGDVNGYPNRVTCPSGVYQIEVSLGAGSNDKVYETPSTYIVSVNNGASVTAPTGPASVPAGTVSITNISPESGIPGADSTGTKITITGTGFDSLKNSDTTNYSAGMTIPGATRPLTAEEATYLNSLKNLVGVEFGNPNAIQYGLVVSNTKIEANLNVGAQTGRIKLYRYNGSVRETSPKATSAVNFIVASGDGDATPPVISQVSPVDGATITTESVTLSARTNERATCKYSTVSGFSFDGTSAINMPASDAGGQAHAVILTGLTNGTKSYYVKCKDNFGNTTPTANQGRTTFTVNLTPVNNPSGPTVTITAPTGNPAVGNSMNITATVTATSGTVSNVNVRIGGGSTLYPMTAGTGNTYTYTADTSKLSGGSYGITVTATANGITNRATASFRVENPTITSVDPTSASIGQTIKINGTNFNRIKGINTVAPDKVEVSFGSNAANRTTGIAMATVNEAGTELTVVVPQGAVTGQLYIKRPESAASSYLGGPQFTVNPTSVPTTPATTAQLADAITCAPNPADTSATVTCSGTLPANATATGLNLRAGTTTATPVTCTVTGNAISCPALTMPATAGTVSIYASTTGTGSVTNHIVDTVTVNVRQVAGAPTLLLPANNATNVAVRPTFTWQPEAGETSYYFALGTSATTLNQVYQPVTGTSYTLTSDLQRGVTYYWTVLKGSDTTSRYPTFSFTTLPNTTDVTAPTITVAGATAVTGGGSVLVDANATAYSLSLTTNKTSVCKVIPGTLDTGFAAATAMTAAGNVHTQNLTLPTIAAPYSYRIQCINSAAPAGTAGSAAYYQLTVNRATGEDTIAPVITVVTPTGSLALGTTSTELKVTTNEAAACRLGTTSTFDYATSTNNLTVSSSVATNNDQRVHTATLSPLANGVSYTYYIKCRDLAGNINATGTLVQFNVAGNNTDSTILDVVADSEVLRGETADISIKLGNKEFIAVIANVVGNNYAKTVYFYCHESHTANCPTKQATKLVGPRTLSVNWETLGVNPGEYQVKVSARVDANTLYRDEEEEIDVVLGSAAGGDCGRYFADMTSTSPLCSEVSYLRERGIFMGQEINGRRVANLNSTLLRSEFFAVATRLYGSASRPVGSFNSLLRFTDVSPAQVANPANAWWMTAILQLDGIVKGYADGTLRPTQNITMAELAKVTSLSTGFISFFDEGRDPWFADIVDAYRREGINFSGNVTARRGDAVKLIYDTLMIRTGGPISGVRF